MGEFHAPAQSEPERFSDVATFIRLAAPLSQLTSFATRTLGHVRVGSRACPALQDVGESPSGRRIPPKAHRAAEQFSQGKLSQATGGLRQAPPENSQDP